MKLRAAAPASGCYPVETPATADYLERVTAAIRNATGDSAAVVERDHSLVLDLGFDSLKVALLSLALESEFGCVVMLDGWIGAHADPNELTVGSLCDHLQRTLAPNGRSAASR